MENEIWKDIPEYEGLYQVSNLGRVKNLNNYHSKKETFVKPYKSPRGYLKISLSKNRTRKYFLAHRLVAFAFIENVENKPFINHINGIKDDNRVENLEWCTNEENKNHALNNNLYKLLDNHSRAILNVEKVKQIKIILRTQKRTVRSIAKEYGVKEGVIHAIKQNKSWKNV